MLQAMHLSGGMANVKQLVNYLTRKWFIDTLPVTCAAQNPQFDCYVGAQAVVLTAPDQYFVTKKDLEEKGA